MRVKSGTACRGVRVGAACVLFGAALASVGLGACSAPAPEPVGSTQEAASANQKIAFDFFLGQGFTNYQAAGIVGNLIQESGAALDPTIHQSGGGVGRGIAQWSTGGRWDTGDKDNLMKFATSKGESPTSLNLQLEFIMFELMNFPEYGLAPLKAAADVSAASIAFEDNFEGCVAAQFPECDQEQRITYSKQVLTAYGNDMPTGTGGAGGGGAGGSGGKSSAGAGGASAGTGGGTAGVSNVAGSASAGAPSAAGSPGTAGSDAAAGAATAAGAPGAAGSPSVAGSPGAAGASSPVASPKTDTPSSCAFTPPRTGKSSDPFAFGGVLLGLCAALGVARRRRRVAR